MDSMVDGVKDEKCVHRYGDAFPPLPSASPSPENTNSEGNWTKSPAAPKMSLRSSTVTQVFQVPLEERRFKDSGAENCSWGNSNHSSTEQARVCGDIMKSFNVSIELSSGKDRSLTVVITGKNDAVMKARREVLNKLQTPWKQQMHIPKEHHRFILGPKGARLQKLELDTATKIQMPRSDEASDAIVLIGTKEGVEKARHEIQLISDEQAKLAMERLPIPKVFHPFIQGPGNRTVNDLTTSYGVRISIPPLSVNKDEIVISGEKEGVKKAAEYVKVLYDDKRKNCQTVSVEVRKSQHRYVLGVRASGIHEILEATGVSVEVPPTDNASETITLRGDPQSLGTALSQVYARANSVVVRVVEAPSWLHRFIIGKGGDNIKAIASDIPKVHIEFIDDQDKISIEGPPDEVNQAEQSLRTIIKRLLQSMACDEVKIDQKYHRYVIGQKGANVNRLKTELGVAIRVPSDSEKSDIIRIEGSPVGVESARKQILDMVEKMANEKSRDIIIEQRLHKQLIGSGGKNIQEIRDKFNNLQITFPEPNKVSEIVTLRGPKNDVDGCYNYLQKFSREIAEANFTAEVRVYKQFHKNVIGKGGATIRQIREETNTKIELPSERAETDMIKITGRKKDVEAARKRIEDIQNTQANMVEDTVTISQKLHNSLIGAKGRLIKAIMDEHGGVQIHFPVEGAKSDIVTLRGPKEDVASAKKALVEAANEKASQSHTAEVRCKAEYHQFLIGRRGAKVAEIRDKTGARIIFPARNDKDQVITVIGTEKAVEEARKELEVRIAALDNVIESSIDVAPQYHKHFLAKRGEQLRLIADEYGGVSVSFPPPNSGKSVVGLKGAKDCVEGAKKRIQEMVEDLEAQVTISCIIAQEHHRSVMGARGSNVQKIATDFGVLIKFPDRPERNVNGDVPVDNGTEKHDAISITGRSEKCEEASKALKALVPITKEVNVVQTMHRYIIGKGGEGVKRIMQNHEVQIAVPTAGDPSDAIKITGVEKAVDEAISAIEDRVKQLELEEEERQRKSFQVEVIVDPKYHPKIIGKRGSVVSKIRDSHDVQIQFPDKKNAQNPDTIVITGYENKCSAAREEILAIVKELEEQYIVEIELDHRVHPRIIGIRGKSLRKIMDDYKVDIRFPGRDASTPDLVTITGNEDDVYDCRERLLNMTEEYIQDIVEKEALDKYRYPKDTVNSNAKNENEGFRVIDAPWSAPDTNSTTDFPDLASASAPRTTPTWGPSVKR